MKQKIFRTIGADKQVRQKTFKTYTVRLHNYVDDVVTDYHRDQLSEAEYLGLQKATCEQVRMVEIIRTEKYETVVSKIE